MACEPESKKKRKKPVESSAEESPEQEAGKLFSHHKSLKAILCILKHIVLYF